MVARDYLARLIMIGVSLITAVGIGYTTYALFVRNKSSYQESVFNIGGNGGNNTKVTSCDENTFVMIDRVNSGVYIDYMNFSCSSEKILKEVYVKYGSWVDKITFEFHNGTKLENGGDGGSNTKNTSCGDRGIREISYKYGRFIDSVKAICN